MGGGSEAATLASASPERLTGGPVGASIPPPPPKAQSLPAALSCHAPSHPLWSKCPRTNGSLGASAAQSEPRDHPDTFTSISLPPSPLRSPPSSLSCFDRLCQNRRGCAAVTRSPRGSVAVRPCPGVTSPGSSRATGPSRPRGRARCRGRGDGPSRQVSEGQIWDVRPAPPPHASERTK